MSTSPPAYYPPTMQQGYNPAPANFDNPSKFQQPPAAGGYMPAAPPQYYNPQPNARHQQSSNVVVVNQPSPMVTLSSVRPVGDHYLTLSIVMTVLCILCGHWHALICTIPAIVFSTMARDADQLGDTATAERHARTSLILNVVAVVFYVILGTVIAIAVIAVIVRAVTAVNSDSYCYNAGYYSYTYNSYDNYCYK